MGRNVHEHDLPRLRRRLEVAHEPGELLLPGRVAQKRVRVERNEVDRAIVEAVVPLAVAGRHRIVAVLRHGEEIQVGLPVLHVILVIARGKEDGTPAEPFVVDGKKAIVKQLIGTPGIDDVAGVKRQIPAVIAELRANQICDGLLVVGTTATVAEHHE